MTTMKNQISVPVLAKGKGWLIVDKPCGLSIHNDPGADLCSVLKSYIETTPLLYDQLFFDPGFGLHAVHRLDRETSGVMLLACRADVFRYYSGQFETRSVRKHYVALLHGKLSVPGSDEDEWGLWDKALSKDAGGRSCPAGKGRGLRCQTRYRAVRHSPHYTLAECEPLTGRKHQIRRHAKLAGHPVVGDQRYSTPRSLKYLKDKCGFNRLGLHSLSVTVRPPDKSKPEIFRSPGIPLEMQKLLDEDQ